MQDETEVLKKVADAVTQKAITFDLDVTAHTWWQRLLQRLRLMPKKRSFSINPLTLNQLQKISKLLLPIALNDFTPDGILKLMINHGRDCAEIVAIAVTESRQDPSKKLIDTFFFNLAKDDMTTALKIVLHQMSVLNFITTIASIRSLNTLETKSHASAKSVEGSEVNPQTQGSSIAPGTLSAVS
jgi:hypothetical protein